VVFRGTHPFTTAMVLVPLSMRMPYRVTTHHHIITPCPTLMTLDGRITLAFPIRTLTLNLRVLCSYLDSNVELPTIHNLSAKVRCVFSYGEVYSNLD